MLALDEKVRTVVLLSPQLVLEGECQEFVAKCDEQYVEAKARKQVYLTKADAEQFFHYLPAEERGIVVEAMTRGLSEVIVMEHLDGDVVERMVAITEELAPVYGQGSIYCSSNRWEALRDIEFFFPHLSQLPVERTLAVIKPDGLARGMMNDKTLEELIEDLVSDAGLFIVAKRTLVLEQAEAEALCSDLRDTKDFPRAVGVLTADEGAMVMCLEGPGAVHKWLLLCGPTSSNVARERAPTTIRANWGTDSTSNAVHASSSMEAAESEIKLFFPEGTLQLQRSLCIVKPHALRNLLDIRMAIEAAGFTVLKEKQSTLASERAQEFYRDYGEQPSFQALVDEAVAGPCYIMVLCRLEAVSVLQQLMGPEDVAVAKASRPNSLRARFGKDGQQNALHGSSSVKVAAREVQFFFPELGSDPLPSDDEVRDYVFRKSAGASMDLKSISDADAIKEYAVDPTLQQLLSRGLMALCQVQPKGLAAVRWLSRWLMENNPNTAPPREEAPYKFQPGARIKQFADFGINQDGLAFAVEMPTEAPKKKKVIDVDTTEEPVDYRKDLERPPYVVFIAGGPGSGKGTQCAKIREEFNLVHLSTGDLMRQEVAAETYLGTEVFKHMQAGTLVPDEVTLQLLKKSMLKHKSTNRFLLDGFPRSVEQAKKFEEQIGEVAFVLYFETSEDVMRQRIEHRAAAAPGRADDNPETVENRLSVFREQTVPVVDFYAGTGRLRRVDASRSVEEVYADARAYFKCRFLYLLGPPGAPVPALGARFKEKYGFGCVDVPQLLEAYGKSREKDAEKVKQTLAKGKPVDDGIVCPLVLDEIGRGMSLGVHTFTLCDFPQTLKQAQFLELRIPSTTRPLLLDFSRADADDLGALARSGDATQVETRSATFFGAGVQEMLKALPGLERVPCSFAGQEPVVPGAKGSSAGDAEQHLVDSAWKGALEKVKPGLTLVLGLPGSGTDVLAQELAALTPNTQAVDCKELLEKEVERKTVLGIKASSMLEKSPAFMLGMVLVSLKQVVNVTCSSSLVVQNFPLDAPDELQEVLEDFRIDRVFYIHGSDKAVSGWKTAYLAKSKHHAADSKAFDRQAISLQPIVAHFSRLGKLERLNVEAKATAAELRGLLEQATLPKFVMLTGPSEPTTSKQAELLAAASGAPALTIEKLQEWSASVLQETLDAGKPEDVFVALKKYANTANANLVVLDRYPKTAEDAAPFLEVFGPPKVIAHITCDAEFLEQEYTDAHEDEDIDPDELTKKFEDEKAVQDAMMKVFEEKCPASIVTLEQASMKSPEDASATIRSRLRPRVFVVVAPSGAAVDFSGLVADGLCGASRRCSAIDAVKLLRPGGHSPALEAELYKASFTAESPDSLPRKLWVELFREAMAKSANPMGDFLITNFPTPCGVKSSPTVRDQFCMLESLASLAGILHVQLGQAAFAKVSGAADGGEWQAYGAFEEAVRQSVLVQYDARLLCQCALQDFKDPAEAAAGVAAEFLKFQDSL